MKITTLGIILSSLLAGLAKSVPAAGINGKNVNGLNKLPLNVLQPLNRQALADVDDSEFPTINDMILLAYCLNYDTEDSCANLFRFIHYYFLNKLQTDQELIDYLSDAMDTPPEIFYTETSVTSFVTTVIDTSYISQDVLTDEFVTITHYLTYSNSNSSNESDKTDINTDINNTNGGECPSITLPLPITNTVTQTLATVVTETVTTTSTFTPTVESPPLECSAILADNNVTDCISKVGYIQLDPPPTDCALLDKYVGEYRPNFVNCFVSLGSTVTEIHKTETTTITESGSIITVTEAAIPEITTVTESSLVTTTIETTTTETDIATKPGSTTTIEITTTETDIATKPGPTITITQAALTESVTVTEYLSATVTSTPSIIITDFILSTATETSLIYTRDDNSKEPEVCNSNSNSNNVININNIYPGGGMLYGYGGYPENEYYPYWSSNGCEDYGGMDGYLVNYNGEEGLSTSRGIYFINGTFVTFHVDCTRNGKLEAAGGSRELSAIGNKTEATMSTIVGSLSTTITSSSITGDNNITQITEYYTNTHGHFMDKDKEYIETQPIDEDCTETPFIDSSKCSMVFITHPADCSDLYPHGH